MWYQNVLRYLTDKDLSNRTLAPTIGARFLRGKMKVQTFLFFETKQFFCKVFIQNFTRNNWIAVEY